MDTATTERPPSGEGLSVEKVWAMFQEIAESSKETDKEIKETARKAGFFVIEQSGDMMKIDMPEGFVPREF